ncbi:site-2 protease family protein [Candidatus Micrarchaeota archaeon]|nr:site-2 protease family protein [Candidatus Micrarchaeota archaeon]MBD3417798.1 site-2 protease family protein [Candidatus Micrarchaeota archaeon]
MRISISNREAQEILISVIAISLALAVNQIGIVNIGEEMGAFVSVASFFLVALGIGFILHEMAHKFTANFFGHYAEFRMWTQGLGFMFLLAALPTRFMFIAPGAVYIHGYGRPISKTENGIISIAGPVTNVVIAIIAIAALFITGPFALGTLGGVELWSSVAWINTFLALFNLLPIYPLDGSKVLAWNPVVYGAFGVFTLLLFFTFGGF